MSAWHGRNVICSLLAMLVLAGAVLAADSAVPYVKKSTWADTMLAARAAYSAWQQESHARMPIKLGPWFATKPLKAQSFSESLFPEKGVDLDGKQARGRSQWQKRAEWVDGLVQSLPNGGGASGATYLYRTITAEKPLSATASFGSDDGIIVWLNGKQVHSKDAARGPAPDQDLVKLDLQAGENQLLVKIYNRSGGHGYYFSLLNDPLAGLWQQIARDFPGEAGLLRQHLPNNTHLEWFKNPASTDLEKRILSRLFGDMGQAGQGLRDELAALQQAKTPGSDPRWLNLVVKTSRFSAVLTEAKGVNTRALRLAIEDLCKTYPQQYTRGPEFLKQLDECEKALADLQEDVGKRDASALKRASEISLKLANLQRDALLANPLLDFDRLLLVKRDPKHMGLPQNWQGNCSLPSNAYDNEIAVLSPVRPDGKLTTFYKPDGGRFVGDVDLNFDADKMLFSMPVANGRWHIFEINADGKGLRQVTPNDEPDINHYDPCYRPDGKILFASTIAFQGVPCVGGSDAVANLAVMDPDGKNIRQLCFDQDHNWCPTIMNDGRVLFSRWEYSDTAHYFSRLLFRMNPDGTGQMQYYGSNSYWPNSLFYARPLPNHPTKVVAIVSGHHGVTRMGELVVLDPATSQFEADGAVQRIPGHGKSVEPVIKDQLVNSSWPKFLHPYPLSDKYFLVSAQLNGGGLWGIYLVDLFDNMVLIHQQPGYAMLEPLPLRKTPRPPVVPDRVNPSSREATVYIADIYQGDGLKGVPRGTVKNLRLYEVDYTYPRMGGHINIGVEGPWDVHRILGTVPVNADGSAMFKVPANTPISVQPLDAEGKALQIMRSWFTAMPGEVLSCGGCHEKQNATPPAKRTLASAYGPVNIEPWHGPARGFSFKREVQPVLDQYCVGCHDGKPREDGQKLPDLSAKPKNGWGNFTPSYLALHPYVRRPGPESDYHLQAPLEFHADTSELIQMLKKGHHNVKLDAEAWERLATWIDLNVPDHGTWGEHRAIPNGYHQRRIALRTKYANRPEDPEFIPEIKRQPAAFVKPEPELPRQIQRIECPNWPFDPSEAQKRQAALGPNTRKTIDLGNGLTLDLVLIPAGEYVMGDPNGDADALPLSRVRIDKPFWMGTCEITNKQFARFDPAHDSGFVDQHHKDHTTPGYPANLPDQPVIRVSWHQAMAFCQWLSQTSGGKFSLPTEAQWEWACRAGSASGFSYGDLNTDFSTHANLADLSIRLLAVSGVNPQPMANPNEYQDFLPKDARFNDHEKIMTSVGKYAPNAWGLFDMHGNVAEWTLSAYQPYPYQANDGRNDLAASALRVVRGGSFFDRPKRATSAFRLAYRPYHPVHNVGFRVICEAQ